MILTDYNQMLDILVTNQREFYQLKSNNGYYIQKVTLGVHI